MPALPVRPRAPPARQRGWVGLVVLLLALAIVAILAKDALKQYGLLGGDAATQRSTAPADRLRNPGLGPAPLDPSGATPVPATAIERARGVEDMVKQQADESAKRIDAAGK